MSYTFTITSTGDYTDTFALAATGNWTATLSDSSVELAMDESATFELWVTVSMGAEFGEQETTTVTATSGLNTAVSATTQAVTTATNQKVYLPFVMR